MLAPSVFSSWPSRQYIAVSEEMWLFDQVGTLSHQAWKSFCCLAFTKMRESFSFWWWPIWGPYMWTVKVKKKYSLSTVYWQFIQYAYYSLVWLLPDTTEARYLYNYAQSLDLLDDPLNNPELSTEGLDREYTENIRSQMSGQWNQPHRDATLWSSCSASRL